MMSFRAFKEGSMGAGAMVRLSPSLLFVPVSKGGNRHWSLLTVYERNEGTNNNFQMVGK